MNNIPSEQSSIVNPEQVTSAINAAFAEFLAVESPIINSHQENTNLSRNNRTSISNSIRDISSSTSTSSSSSSSTITTTSSETTNLPRYKTLLDKYTTNNEQQNSNRRKRSISNDYNSSKRFRSSTGK